MAKSKSSASSATRKKQAAKQAKKKQQNAEDDDLNPSHTPQKPQRGQKKQKKDRFAPKVKSYVPPPPPPKGAPDPVDLFLVSQGKQIDPELVVVLRRLHKKDEATIGKGVEGFDAAVREVLRREQTKVGEDWERELKEEEILECVAVWAHHFPRLALHPSRRLRLSVHSLHSLLSSASTPLLKYTRSALLSALWTDQPNYVGAWCVTAFDSDRTLRNQAFRTFESVLLPISTSAEQEEVEESEGINLVEQAESVTQFAFSLILGSPSNDTPGSETPEDPAFLRTSAISALVYLMQKLPRPLPLEENTIETLMGEEMWDMLAVRDQERTGEKEQPKMVRRALYELLGAVVARDEDLMIIPRKDEEEEEGGDEEENDERLRTISRLVLENCWTEEEGWPGIIGFLRRYPQAWTLADIALDSAPSVDEENDDEEEEETETSTSTSAFTPSPTLTRLFSHLALACSSHPTPLYPTILLLLSTIPDTVLPTSGPFASTALNLLFENFYSAYSSRAVTIGGVAAGEAWLGALLECLVFETSKVEDVAVSQELVKEWVGRVWRAFLNVGEEAKTRGLASRRTAEEIEKTLTRFASREDKGAFNTAWEIVEKEALRLFSQEDTNEKSLEALVMALKAIRRSTSDEVKEDGRELAKKQVQAAITAIQQGQDERREDMLKFLASTKDLVKDDPEVQQQLDDLCLQHLAAYISTSTHSLSLLVSHLATTSPESRSSIWKSLFATSPAPLVFLRLIDSVSHARLDDELPSAELDTEVVKMAQKVLSPGRSGSEDELEVLRRIMLHPKPFVDASLPKQLVTLAIESLTTSISSVLTSSSSPSTSSLSPLVPATALVANYTQTNDNSRDVAASDSAVVALSQVGYLLPLCRIDSFVQGEAVAAAQQAWQEVAQSGEDEMISRAMVSLKSLLSNVKARPSAIEIVQAASDILSTSPSTQISLSSLLPSLEELSELFSKLSLAEPSPALSVLEPLVCATDASSSPYPSAVDSAFLSAYPRALLGFLEIASRDLSLARKSLWIVPHLLLFTLCAKDQLSLSNVATGMFGASITPEILERLIASGEGASSYLLSSATNSLSDGWHAQAVTHLRSKEPLPTEDQLLAVLDGLARQAKGMHAKAIYAQRAVSIVLSSALRYSESGAQDAERWLALAQNSPSAPGFSCAILSAIRPILLETPRFERYQNELAASLAGVSPSQLDSKGLPLLRQILAVAPPADAPIIFLPQQRTMFLVQAIQKWIGSDEGLPEEANAATLKLLSHLVAIIQDLSGSHWDLVFDLIESNLDAADWDEPTTLPAVYQSCLLLAQMKDLSSSNAELRAVAKDRVVSCLELVLHLFVSRPVSQERNAPRAEVVSTMARLVMDLPPKLLTMDKSFEQLLRLLQDPSLAVQISSYDLLRRVVQKHVEDLVVEVELDTEEKIEIQLPRTLVNLLQTKLDGDEMDSPEKASTYLLAWLTAFAFFGPASPRIRSAYIDQLRNDDLVTSSLLPSLFGLLNLSDRTRPTDLSPWAIDDFHLEVVETLEPQTLPVFAAHVYYRALQAVPSVIRTYWASLQNLQLSRTIQSFTSRNFSPLLIAAELSSLRDPASDTGKQLRDNDDFAVKVAAGANEVKCTFVVDEETMEIGIKVPSEFPLVGVEVKDVRKVGVTDKQWRAWLLAMQQVISTQSAAIADALLLFKRNVTLHFEGVESCAICYSTVSTVDRSLPSKSYKTCENKFHAGCLYKWFTTSHSSTCPLCRQIM
ncbi:ubiquitin-protein ligase RKR1 [Sporobolomyces salmoneus]|uniref:ubiquitin-protein ligase RKR1 n=1 Tax=Sporobolomyces salmoneus TaxID=183962 RepID=UPI003170F923